MAIKSNINASIKKAPFEVFHDESIPLSFDLLLSHQSGTNPQVQKFTRKTQKKFKAAMFDYQQLQKPLYDPNN